MIKIVFGAIFLFAGLIGGAIAVLGMYRFKFVMNRMHSAAIVDALCLSFIIVGLIILSFDLNFVFKLLLIAIFQWVGSPIAAHMVMRLEAASDKSMNKHVKKETVK